MVIDLILKGILMKKIIAIALLLGSSIMHAQWEPPVDYSPATDECTMRFGKRGSGRYACGRSIDVCQNWFGLTGQAFQDCQEGVLLLNGIRESDYPL